ncbi:hypothetical protein GW17_00008947 [Ensete ventricosum]|nr:hypothetical protein GW17_00008947 [Ensete ventricosum]
MKIAWKTKAAGGGGKKRSLPSPVALNPSLPFDRGEDDPPAADARAEAGRTSPDSGQETPTHDHHHHINNLADSFRCQGNQLAEVSLLGPFSPSLPPLEIVDRMLALRIQRLGRTSLECRSWP